MIFSYDIIRNKALTAFPLDIRSAFFVSAKTFGKTWTGVNFYAVWGSNSAQISIIRINIKRIPHLQRRGRVLDRKFCLFVCLSAITFSFSEYWIIWWFTLCKPYIFWKHITLATSGVLFWPSFTKCRPEPPYIDQVTTSAAFARHLFTLFS